MTFTYKIPCFDLEQTAGSGQVFRMIPAPGRTNTWQVISQGHVCFIRQENDIFFLECGPDLENFWKYYFDLNTAMTEGTYENIPFEIKNIVDKAHETL